MGRKLLSLILLLLLLSLPAWGIDYEDADCKCALLMEVDELTLTDSSGEGNTGVLLADGEPDYATAAPPDTYSVGYYVFDDGDDKVTIPSVTLAESTSFTVWLNPVAIGQDMFLGEDDGDNYFALVDGNTLRNQDDNSSDDNFDWSGTVFANGTWVHVAWTKAAGSDQNVYADGVASDDSPINDAVDTIATMVGQGYSGNNYDYAGDIDEFSHWSKELTSTDINNIMDNGLAPAEAPTGYGQII